ncbi:YdbH family protein [Edwardsiella piscicida]|uniref:YdbH family protein n=1 Tax=Edwardsiella piscicida TaxID=1263550 RepID=UPI00370DD535
MKKRYIGAIGAAVLLSGSVAAWWSSPYWLSAALRHWLPAGADVMIPARPYWSDGALRLPRLDYRLGACPLLSLRGAALSYRRPHWQLNADTVDLDSRCFSAAPGGGTMPSIASLQQSLPPLALTIGRLNILPWQRYGGTLRLNNQDGAQRIGLDGEQLKLDLALEHQALSVRSLLLRLPQLDDALQLQGKIALGLDLATVPPGGLLQAQFRLSGLPHPLRLRLIWQRQGGRLLLNALDQPRPLVDLPWQQQQGALTVSDGQWFWPYGPQPLQGSAALQLRDWLSGWRHAQLQGRVNMLTRGKQGKANMVMQLGPGRLDFQAGAFPLRLNGLVNHGGLSFSAALDARVSGTPEDPTLRLLPGALLRIWGKTDAQTTLQEVRWPLAGVRVSRDGVSGRLQAILRVSHRYWGQGQLHLDGQAEAFRPDKGLWRWRYWGKGQMPPLRARWDVSGQGAWQDDALHLDYLSAGFDRLTYGLARVIRPRLTLTQPLMWLRASQHAAFHAGFALAAQRIDFTHGGYLPTPRLQLTAQGESPASMQLRGDLRAGAIGPIRLDGRWDGTRLRGQAWWASQPVTVFQPLLTPSLGVRLREGQFHAQAAFSAARGQGFVAGGHLQAKGVGLWLKDGRVDAMDLTLPYRLHDSRWQLGPHTPVTLRIDRLVNQFDLRKIRADLQGYYPYDEASPLTLSDVTADMLGGEVGFSSLRLPQHQPTLLRLHNIELSELITALKVKQFALSGKVDGELPLYLHNPQWIIHRGWLGNTRPVTLRLDKDMVDAIVSNNPIGGAALDWLRYLEVGRSHTWIDLSNLGELTLDATLYGINRQKDHRRVIELNYRQQENVFQLWRSLRFGDNVQEWLQSRLSRATRSQHE